MGQDHLKRIATPKTWGILRKVNTFITRPNPGAHSYYKGQSLNTVMKEDIGIARTTKEVDGKKRHDEKHNVGFMDVITFPATKESYRIGFTKKGKLKSFAIDAKEANVKITKITGKHHITGGKTQLLCEDGRTINIDKDNYKVGDSALI